MRWEIRVKKRCILFGAHARTIAALCVYASKNMDVSKRRQKYAASRLLFSPPERAFKFAFARCHVFSPCLLKLYIG